MGNIILCDPSVSDATGGPYSITSAQTYAPSTNLLTMQPKEIWESTSTATQTLKFSLNGGIATTFNFAALLFTNLTTSAVVTFTGRTTTIAAPSWTASLSIAAGMSIYERPHVFFYTTSVLTTPVIWAAIADTANPDAVIRVGRFYAGNAYTPTYNAMYGLRLSYDAATDEVVTVARERITRSTEAIPGAAFTLQAFGSGAWDEIMTYIHPILRKRGSSKDVVVVIDPTDGTYAGRLVLYGTLQQKTEIVFPQHNLFETALELRGLI